MKEIPRLAGGQACDAQCRLIGRQGNSSLSVSALLDTGANISALADRRMVPELQKIGFRLQKHPKIYTTGHNDEVTGEIVQYATGRVELAGRVHPIQVLIGETGNHDLIVGRRFLAEKDALIDVRNRSIVWRSTSPARWDDGPREALAQLARSDAQINEIRTTTPLPRLTRRKSSWREYKEANISLISAAGFKTTADRLKATVGVTSIYEIDRLIEDFESGDDPLDRDPEEVRQLIAERLPTHLQDLKDVFSKAKSDELAPHRGRADHRIELKEGAEEKLAASPSPLYGMDAEKLKLVKEYLTEHLHKGFIEPSDAQFASPVLFAKKPNGGLRFCVDYRRLNEQTKKDRYTIPLITETLAKLRAARYFTKLDVRQAFYKIRMAEGSTELTTFRTRFGSYKYNVLPFGLCNGPASFQRYINDLLFEKLDDFCTAYIDDILIFSNSRKEHKQHVRWVLEKLRAAGLQADIKKSEFTVKRTRFTGPHRRTGRNRDGSRENRANQELVLSPNAERNAKLPRLLQLLSALPSRARTNLSPPTKDDRAREVGGDLSTVTRAARGL